MPGHFREVVQTGIPAITALIGPRSLVLPTVFQDRPREFHREIGEIRPGPSVRNPVPRDQRRTHHADFRPQCLAVIIVDAVVEIQDHMAFLPFWIRIPVHADALGGRQFHLDAGIRQRDLVMAGACRFGFVAETLPIAGIRVLGRSGDELDFSRPGHEQDVAQVRMPGPAEVRVTEAHDRAVAILVAGAVLIGTRLVHAFDVVRDHVRVRRKLHAAEGNAGAREGMSHAGRADQRVHIGRTLRKQAGRDAGPGPKKYQKPFHAVSKVHKKP